MSYPFRVPYGKTEYNKCQLEGCNIKVRQTASMRRRGEGKYCSREHMLIVQRAKRARYE